MERRSYTVILLLSWRGPLLPSGERERVEVGAKDVKGNTALHYAASNGLRKCVEYLVAHGADLCSENVDGLTACELALKNNHHDIGECMFYLLFNPFLQQMALHSAGVKRIHKVLKNSTLRISIPSK